jgi:hypothetical protein
MRRPGYRFVRLSLGRVRPAYLTHLTGIKSSLHIRTSAVLAAVLARRFNLLTDASRQIPLRTIVRVVSVMRLFPAASGESAQRPAPRPA